MLRRNNAPRGAVKNHRLLEKPIEVKKLRGAIDTEILLANIAELKEKHEPIAVEIVRLAEKRHGELTK